jgi:signal transduction histidine kinase
LGGTKQSMAAVGGQVTRAVVVVLVMTAASAMLASALSLTRLTPTVAEATALVRALAAPAFMVGGVLRLGRWRITGESACGLRGLAMLMMGGIALPSAAVARAISASDDLTTVTFARALTVAAILYVTAVALSDDSTDRAHLDRRVIEFQVAAGAGVAGVLLVGHQQFPRTESWDLLAAQGVVGALAIGWLTLAVGAGLKARHEPWARPLAPLLAAMGLAEVLRLPDRPVTTLAAVALTAAVGFAVAGSALVDLLRAAQEERSASEHLSRELADARHEVDSREAWRADLTHDARSTLAGIRAAMHALDRHAAELDQPTADRLRVATLAELSHLEQLLVGPGEDIVFDVADVVRTVTDVRREAGQSIEVVAAPALVHGALHDVATTLQNLLVNTAVHAPGSVARIEVRTRKQWVDVVVSDDGPGLPAGLAGTVFERGVRGAASVGSGLGLSIARSLARRQGGELELAPSARGTAFRLTLPAAVTSGTPALSAQAAS